MLKKWIIVSSQSSIYVCPQIDVDNSLFGPLFSRSKGAFLTKKVKNIVYGPIVSEKLCFVKIPKTYILKSEVTPNFFGNATFKLYIHIFTHNVFRVSIPQISLKHLLKWPKY